MSDERPPSPPSEPPEGPAPPPPPGPEPEPAPEPQQDQQREPAAPTSDEDARSWAMLAHLAGVALFLGPLIVWILKKDSHEFVADQSREALNFQITMTIFAVIAFVLNLIPLVNCLTGIVTLAVFLADVVLIILAAVKANDGVRYRYPVALRILD
jgi:uncharacterized Tic20 family protein